MGYREVQKFNELVLSSYYRLFQAGAGSMADIPAGISVTRWVFPFGLVDVIGSRYLPLTLAWTSFSPNQHFKRSHPLRGFSPTVVLFQPFSVGLRVDDSIPRFSSAPVSLSPCFFHSVSHRAVPRWEWESE